MIVAANPALDAILQLALSASAGFHDELRAVLLDRLSLAYDAGAGTDHLLAIVQHTLNEFASPLADILVDARLAGLLTGAGQVAEAIPTAAPASPPGPPRRPGAPTAEADWSWDWNGDDGWMPMIDEAARSLREKRLMTGNEWNAATKAERNRAFSVAGQQSLDAVGHIRDSLLEAVRDGTGLEEFRARIEESLDTSPSGPGTSENIFRTAVQSAYSEGTDRILDHPLVGEAFPYEQTVPIDDSRLTDLCATISTSGLDGTGVYRRDDPVWRRFKPPRHWRCRCGRRVLTVRQAADLGIREAEEWQRTGEPPERPEHVPWPHVDLPKGWVPGGGIQLSRAIWMAWTPFTGPRGGRGFVNEKGRKIYRATAPQERKPKMEQPGMAPKLAPKAKPSPKAKTVVGGFKPKPVAQPAPKPTPTPPVTGPSNPPTNPQTVPLDIARKVAERGYTDPASAQRATTASKQIVGSGLTGEPLRQALNAHLDKAFPWKTKQPAVAPAPIAPVPKPAAPAARPHAERIHAAIHAHLAKQKGLSDQARQHYSDSAKRVLSRMPSAALSRFAKHVKRMSFYETSAQLGQSLAKVSPKVAQALAMGSRVGGCYRTGSEASLHLDGQFSAKSALGGDYSDTHHTYGHEFAHAVDGPEKEISNSKEWQDAWQQEIGGGKLSRYATTSAAEGFAEFGRLAYASDVDRKVIEQNFPKCAALWQERGIW